MTPFEIVVDALGPEACARRFEVDPDWWSARDEAEQGPVGQISKPLTFELALAKPGEAIELEGSFQGEIELECSRCAKRYSQRLREDFRLVLSPVHSNGQEGRDPLDSSRLDPEGKRGLSQFGICLGEDLEAGWFKGPVIQLDDVFGEVIALAMPLQPQCRGAEGQGSEGQIGENECPGVCPQCGVARDWDSEADQALARCGCVEEKVDSPFAVLAQLKEKS